MHGNYRERHVKGKDPKPFLYFQIPDSVSGEAFTPCDQYLNQFGEEASLRNNGKLWI